MATSGEEDALERVLRQAVGLAGRDLAWIAERVGVSLPQDPKRSKGWTGGLLEAALGATGGSQAVVDFPEVGLELKSLPVNRSGRVLESTYVCTAPLDGSLAGTWEESWVRAKLNQVLWVPVVGDPAEAFFSKQIGIPFLWSPSASEEGILRQDWEEETELLCSGRFDALSAHLGEVLQVRPKGANSSTMTEVLDAEGRWTPAGARGFYLRRSFTQRLLDRALGRGGKAL